ncbi:unnamed protein product [Ixodes pacificus]
MALGTEASQNRSWVKALTKNRHKKKKTRPNENAWTSAAPENFPASRVPRLANNGSVAERPSNAPQSTGHVLLHTSLSSVSRSNKLAQTRTTTREKYRRFRVKVAMHSRTGLGIGKCATSRRSAAFGRNQGTLVVKLSARSQSLQRSSQPRWEIPGKQKEAARLRCLPTARVRLKEESLILFAELGKTRRLKRHILLKTRCEYFLKKEKVFRLNLFYNALPGDPTLLIASTSHILTGPGGTICVRVTPHSRPLRTLCALSPAQRAHLPHVRRRHGQARKTEAPKVFASTLCTVANLVKKTERKKKKCSQK